MLTAAFFAVLLCMAAPSRAEHAITFGLHMNKPLNFKDTDGQAKGLIIDVFSHIANQEGWKVTFAPCEWAECLSRLKSGEIDVLSAIGFTEKRAKIYDFTETPLITNWGLVVTQPNTPIQSVIDLEGTTIAVMKRAGHTTVLQALMKEFGINANYLEVDSFKSVLRAVDDKKANAGVVNRLFATQFINDYQVIKSSIIFNPVEIRYAFTKGKHGEILKVVDRYLLQMRKDKGSVYFQALDRWFGQDKGDLFPIWLKWLTGSLTLIIGFLFMGTLALKNRVKKAAGEIVKRRVIEIKLIEKTELQQLLYKVTAIANETNDADAGMAACLKEICDYTTWPVGHIYAVSRSDPDLLIPTNSWHLEDPEWFADFHGLTMKTTFKKGVGMPGRVLASGAPEWIEDVTGNPEFIRAVQGVDIIVKAGFCFPIKVRNEVVAVMEFFSPFAQKADRALMQSIENIGTQIGRLHERASAEMELLKAKEAAEAANKAKSTFLSSMSHELRTPLNAIIGFSGMIKEETFGPINNDDYCGYVKDIHHSGQHLLELINDILDVSSIEANALELYEENISLTDIVETSIHLIQPLADERQVRINVHIDPKTPTVYADGRRVEQVLLNLLSNAVKFTPEKGEVTVSAQLNDNGSLSLIVSDTGVGMTEEETKTAISRFGQVENNLNRSHEGTGLGLPLTIGLMEKHDGTLEIKSKKDLGTTISATFPSMRVGLNDA